MLTSVEGITVGHWTDAEARTGCTVVLLPPNTVASGEVRGGAPGTREFDLLDPNRLVQHVDAIVLAGGSAFGLSACDGVTQWLAARGRGHRTAHASVPIVVGMVIYDLGIGRADVYPTAASGFAACEAADASTLSGPIGAGTGATFHKLLGIDHVRNGGIAQSTVVSDDVVVSSLLVLNAIGNVGDPTDDDVREIVPRTRARDERLSARENTTIGVIATNARLDKRECFLVAQAAHHGLARSLWPSHLSGDGDAFVVVSVPSTAKAEPEAPVDAVKAMATHAVCTALSEFA